MDVTFLILNTSKLSAFFESVELSSFLALVVVLFDRGIPRLFVLHLDVKLLQPLSQTRNLFLELLGRLLEVQSFYFVDF